MPENRSFLAPQLPCLQRNCFPIRDFEIFLDCCLLTWAELFSNCNAMIMSLNVRKKILVDTSKLLILFQPNCFRMLYLSYQDGENSLFLQEKYCRRAPLVQTSVTRVITNNKSFPNQPLNYGWILLMKWLTGTTQSLGENKRLVPVCFPRRFPCIYYSKAQSVSKVSSLQQSLGT